MQDTLGFCRAPSAAGSISVVLRDHLSFSIPRPHSALAGASLPSLDSCQFVHLRLCPSGSISTRTYRRAEEGQEVPPRPRERPETAGLGVGCTPTPAAGNPHKQQAHEKSQNQQSSFKQGPCPSTPYQLHLFAGVGNSAGSHSAAGRQRIWLLPGGRSALPACGGGAQCPACPFISAKGERICRLSVA